MKQGVEALCGIRYKFQIMGVEVSRLTYIYGDYMSVIHNTSKPESVLNKKSNSICYHFFEGSCHNEEILDNTCPYP